MIRKTWQAFWAAEGPGLVADLDPKAARAKVQSAFGRIRAELEQLVRIPSVSAAGFDAAHVRQSAEATASWLTRSGFEDVRLLEVEGAHPAVYAAASGPGRSPRVLLYAHHDVQPPGMDELWKSPPFEPAERDGRLFGRGTADDKAGIAVHVAALTAWRGKPPVDLAVFIEGEEEIGSAHLPEFLRKYRDLLRADTVVIPDCSNWAIGKPTLITSLRGLLDCVVELRTLDFAVHSGKYGGPVPDALTALCRLIATLHDPAGNSAVAGLHADLPHSVPVDAADLREAVGLTPGVQFIGDGSLSHRLWARPAITVLGIDAPSVLNSAHNLTPVARASISVRLAPGDDAHRAFEAMEQHLHQHAPWGASVQVRRIRQGEPYRLKTDGQAFDAFRRACTDTWGRVPIEAGSGGSLPLVAALADSFPEMALLLTGVDDPDSKAHSENESVHLSELLNCCISEAILLGYLAEGDE
jgi:acetylornithine deacetylase/succinyl-diaminopimelate desuccinylase-like protein